MDISTFFSYWLGGSTGLWYMLGVVIALGIYKFAKDWFPW